MPILSTHYKYLLHTTAMNKIVVCLQVAVVHSANVMATLPEVYTEPDSYRPERWDRDSADTPHPFASLPFGVGPRMCIGMEIVVIH